MALKVIYIAAVLATVMLQLNICTALSVPEELTKNTTNSTGCSVKYHEVELKDDPFVEGFGKIVYPATVTLGVCEGSCAGNSTLYNYLHSRIVGDAEEARCVPTEYHSLAVLALTDDGEYRIHIVEKANVVQCGCL